MRGGAVVQGGRGAARAWAALAVVLAVVALGLFGWKVWSERKLRQGYEQELAEVQARAESVLRQERERLLQLAGAALARAVEEPLRQGDHAGLDTLLQELVKQPGVRRLLVVDREGRIVVSTDKKLEGDPAERWLPAEVTVVQKSKLLEHEGQLLAVVPLIGGEERLGVLVLAASPVTDASP